MRRIHLALTLVVGLSFAATAPAQNSMSSFVIGGDAAKKIHDSTTINLATAERIAETCEDLARKEGVGVSIYILDPDGNHVYMHRMDGQAYENCVIEGLKAAFADRVLLPVYPPQK